MPERTLLHQPSTELSAGLPSGSRFVRACLRQPVDQTPVWFLRQAGRYMPEYQAVRRHHSLLQICKNPDLAAEVTITAAEKLDVDAAIIFADLLLPLEGMGLDFEFQAGEGPVIHHPVRAAADVENLRIDRAHELGYVAEAIRKVVAHFQDRIGIVGFAQLHLHQDPHVPGAIRLAALAREACICAGRICGPASGSRSRRHSDLR
jgi:uroporphyrinogen decarboxylase